MVRDVLAVPVQDILHVQTDSKNTSPSPYSLDKIAAELQHKIRKKHHSRIGLNWAATHRRMFPVLIAQPETQTFDRYVRVVQPPVSMADDIAAQNRSERSRTGLLGATAVKCFQQTKRATWHLPSSRVVEGTKRGFIGRGPVQTPAVQHLIASGQRLAASPCRSEDRLQRSEPRRKKSALLSAWARCGETHRQLAFKQAATSVRWRD